jgi:hypothetical protein
MLANTCQGQRQTLRLIIVNHLSNTFKRFYSILI